MFITANRVRETTSSTGTTDLILSGAVAGHQAFGSVPGIAHGDALYYCAVAANGQWEAGYGLYMTLFGPAVPRIWRQNPKEGSSGPNTLVNFTVSPQIFITTIAAESVARGPFAIAYPSANQVVTAGAAAAKAIFNTFLVNAFGSADAGRAWNETDSTAGGFNEPGWRHIRARVEAVTTFAGDSYLSLWKGGVESVRGPVLSGAKSLTLDADVYLEHVDSAEVRVFSTTGGTILGGNNVLTRVSSRFMPGPKGF